MADNIQQQVEAFRRTELAKLPLFYGNKEKDFFSPEQFMVRCEMARDTGRWDENATKTFVYASLRGTCLSWYETLSRSRVNTLVWAEFKAAFLTAFSTTRTSRTATVNLADLKQGNTESVVSFYARAVRIVDDFQAMAPAHVQAPAQPFTAAVRAVPAFVALPAAEKTEQINLLLDHAATETFNFVATQIFIAGLRPHLREKLMETPPADLYTAFEGALAFEKIRSEPRKTSLPAASACKVCTK